MPWLQPSRCKDKFTCKKKQGHGHKNVWFKSKNKQHKMCYRKDVTSIDVYYTSVAKCKILFYST